MSEGDSFLQEVSEEVRRDRLVATLRKNAVWIGLGVAIILGAAGANEWMKARATAAAQAKGDAIWGTLNAGEPEARLEALQQADAQDPLIAMQLAAIQLDLGNTGEAVSRLQAMAGDGDIDPALRDIARLKLVAAAGDQMDAATRLDILNRLTGPDHALRPLALEQRALIHLSNGDVAAAVEDLHVIADDPQSYPGLRQRVDQLLTAIGPVGETNTDG